MFSTRTVNVKVSSDRIAPLGSLVLLLGFVLASAPSCPAATVTQDQELTRAWPQGGDRSGIAVAIDGDTAVVGAWQESRPGLTQAGAAYVFVRSGGVWNQTAKLIASDAAAGDGFGWAVAIQGSTIYVGAVGDDHGGCTDAGSVYVFRRTGIGWAEAGKIVPAVPDSDDNFGSSIDVLEGTLLVGAPGYSNGSLECGATYVFTRTGVAWIERCTLLPSSPQHLQLFGGSVAFVGKGLALIGSCSKNHGGYQWAGAVYVFARIGMTWVEQDMLVASDPGDYYYFGRGLSVSGNRFITGAYGSDQAGMSSAGSAYIFQLDDNGTPADLTDDFFSEEQKLTRTGAAANDLFGSAVALDGEVAVVGALWVDHSGLTNCGAAYTYCLTAAGWIEQDELIASDAQNSDMFGIAVAMDGDTVIVGAELHDHTGLPNSGAAYVYYP